MDCTSIVHTLITLTVEQFRPCSFPLWKPRIGVSVNSITERHTTRRMSRPTIRSAQTLEYLQLFRANSSRSMMIRDLPFSCANQDVYNLCHEMLGIKPPLVHVIFDTKGYPLHYGYILFDTDDDAHQAISKMDRLRFRGRDIRFVPFNSTGSHEKGRQGAVHVYFRAQGILSSPITEETLRRFLETYGELEHVIIRTYGRNAEGLVEGFGFATFVDANIHSRISSEAKRLVFEGVAYDCTLSRKLSPKAPLPRQSTHVSLSTFSSPPQYAQAVNLSLPTSFTSKSSPADPVAPLSYDGERTRSEALHVQPPALGTASYAIAPIRATAFVNESYSPRPFRAFDGYESPRGQAVIVEPSSVGYHHSTPFSPRQAFSQFNPSLPTVGGYGGSGIPLSHSIPPSPMHALQYSPGLFLVPSFPYQVSPSMPTPPSTTGASVHYMPLSYPAHNASPFPEPFTVLYGSSPPPSFPRKDAPNV